MKKQITQKYFHRFFLTVAIIAALAVAPQTLWGQPMNLEVFDDFEGLSSNQTEFIIGSTPLTAAFTGGLGGVIGNTGLYFSGQKAWMVDAGAIGTIAFETNAKWVEFYARTNPEATGNSLLEAFDSSDQSLGSKELIAGADWELVGFHDESGGGIAKILFTNNDTNDGNNFIDMNAIDDFGFSPVPLPATLWLFGAALASLTGFATRNNQRKTH